MQLLNRNLKQTRMNRQILWDRFRVNGAVEIWRVVVHFANINANTSDCTERVKTRIGGVHFHYKSTDALAIERSSENQTQLINSIFREQKRKSIDEQ